jgi:hypothetical protein
MYKSRPVARAVSAMFRCQPAMCTMFWGARPAVTGPSAISSMFSCQGCAVSAMYTCSHGPLDDTARVEALHGQVRSNGDGSQCIDAGGILLDEVLGLPSPLAECRGLFRVLRMQCGRGIGRGGRGIGTAGSVSRSPRHRRCLGGGR